MNWIRGQSQRSIIKLGHFPYALFTRLDSGFFCVEAPRDRFSSAEALIWCTAGSRRLGFPNGEVRCGGLDVLHKKVTPVRVNKISVFFPTQSKKPGTDKPRVGGIERKNMGPQSCPVDEGKEP